MQLVWFPSCCSRRFFPCSTPFRPSLCDVMFVSLINGFQQRLMIRTPPPYENRPLSGKLVFFPFFSRERPAFFFSRSSCLSRSTELWTSAAYHPGSSPPQGSSLRKITVYRIRLLFMFGTSYIDILPISSRPSLQSSEDHPIAPVEMRWWSRLASLHNSPPRHPLVIGGPASRR